MSEEKSALKSLVSGADKKSAENEVLQVVAQLADTTDKVMDEFYTLKEWVGQVDEQMELFKLVKQRLISLETWVQKLIMANPELSAELKEIAKEAKEVAKAAQEKANSSKTDGDQS